MICFCVLCHVGEPVCSPRCCQCGAMDGDDAGNSLAVCVLMYGLDVCPGPLSGFEAVV